MFFFHPALHGQHADLPARHDRPGRSLLPALCLAVVTVLGGLLTAPVAATSQPAPPDPAPTSGWPVKIPEEATFSLELSPADERIRNEHEIWLGERRTYKAEAVITVDGQELFRREVTGLTGFELERDGQPSGACEQARCKPGTAGRHTVKGKIPKWKLPRWFDHALQGATSLVVLQPVERLELEPPDGTITAGGNLQFHATGLAGDGQPLRDVTAEATFAASVKRGPPILCPEGRCELTARGDYAVTATLLEPRRKPVTGRAKLTVAPGQPVRLRVKPDSETVDPGVEVEFKAIAEDRYGNSMDRTEQAEFTIAEQGATTGGSCVEVGDEATCQGDQPATTYVITAKLRHPGLSATARLNTLPVDIPIDPSVTVTPGSGSPNTEVVVEGITGSCGRVGRLTLKGTRVRERFVRGKFTTRFKVPPGTATGDYQVLLEVVCHGGTEPAAADFRVTNRPPEPADDSDVTLEGRAVSVPVTRNDTDPDDPDGYPTALEPGAPGHGRTENQRNTRIRYIPDKGFTETDSFQYRLCDVVAGDLQCGTATVTVTVNPREPKPVDDPGEQTRRDESVVIDVMGNDEHPDASRLRVLRTRRPGASAERLPGGDVKYTPEPGYVGQDTFRYDYCGARINAAGAAAACPAATVTVDVGRPPTVVPSTTTTTTTVPPTTTTTTVAPTTTTTTVPPPTVTVISDPVITSVRPDSTAPGRTVKVAGSTGSCGRSGTLTLEETGATEPVTADQRGSFTADLTVPPGTAPRTYTLALGVACRGENQRAEEALTVTNQAPEAADDVETTARDHPVEVEVTGNDRDPDDPDGHQTRLLAGPPIYGTAEVRSDDVIVYTPGPDFVGQDQFQYSLCDNLLTAAGGADCGTATVTVSVTDTPAITSVSPAAAKPGTPVVVTGSTGSCDRSGTLTVEETGMVMQVAAEQNGNFATVLGVPVGTFPGDYRLALRVDCDGAAQQAEATLSVTNEAPQAEDDEADTVSGSAVSIPVVDNDRDPDDPDGYPSLLLVTKGPDHGTAEAQSERTILYTPEPTYSGPDRFRYSLCDSTLNAAGGADCGHATVTVKVADGERCLARDVSSIRVDPGKGRGGARLGITATVDRKLAACPFRLFLGESPLGPDVLAGDDGGITAQRQVPGHVTPGTIPVRLATMRGDVLAQAPFEITRPWPWLSNPFVRGVLGMAALLAGALARSTWRRWWGGRDGTDDDLAAPAEDVRTRAYAGPAEIATERVRDGTRTFAVRLAARHDPGTQLLEEEEEER
jgi:hypothetical protein